MNRGRGWDAAGYIPRMFPELTDDQRQEVGEFLQAIEENGAVHRGVGGGEVKGRDIVGEKAETATMTPLEPRNSWPGKLRCFLA